MGKNSITIHSDLETKEAVSTVPATIGHELEENPLYDAIRGVLLEARKKTYEAINSQMVIAYWSIGRIIVKDEQKGKERGSYGKGVLKSVSARLSAEFGTGFSIRNLQLMKKLYLTYPNANALRTHLTWTHYRALLRIRDDDARRWYELETIRRIGQAGSSSDRFIRSTTSACS